MPYRPEDLKKFRNRKQKTTTTKHKPRPLTKRRQIVAEMQKRQKKGKQPLIEAGEVKAPPKVTPLIQDEEPKKTGSEYAPYPSAAGRAGFEYGRDIGEVLDDKTVSDEIKEKLEEEILYEGDYKGGQVGKGKKMKMKKGGSPKGCGKARRGYGKAMMGGGMVKTKRGYSGGGRLY